MLVAKIDALHSLPNLEYEMFYVWIEIQPYGMVEFRDRYIFVINY